MAETNLILKLKDQASKGLGDVAKAAENLKTNLESAQTAGARLGTVGNALTVGLTGPVIAAAGAMAGLVTSVGIAADQIDKMSERTGISRQSLQELRYAAQQTGVDFNGLDGTFAGFAARLSTELIGGTSAAAVAFAELGVATEDAEGKLRGSGAIIEDTIAAIASIEDPAERSAAALTVFGAEGAKLAPLLNQGAEGIQNLRNRANELGLVLEDATIATLVTLGDSIADVKSAFTGLGNDLVQEFTPILRDDVIPFILNEVVPAIRGIAEAVERVIKWYVDLNDTQRAVVNASVAFVAAIGPVISVFGRLVSAANLVSTALAGIRTAALLATGPAGWAILAATAIGGIAWALASSSNRESVSEASRQAARDFEDLKPKIDDVTDSLTGGEKLSDALDKVAGVMTGEGKTAVEGYAEQIRLLGEDVLLTAENIALIPQIVELTLRQAAIQGQLAAERAAQEALNQDLGAEFVDTDPWDALDRVLRQLADQRQVPIDTVDLSSIFIFDEESNQFVFQGAIDTVGALGTLIFDTWDETNRQLGDRAANALSNTVIRQLEGELAAIETELTNLQSRLQRSASDAANRPTTTTNRNTPEKEPAVDDAAKAWVARLQDQIDIGAITLEQAINTIKPRFNELLSDLLVLDPASQEFKDAKAKWDVLRSSLVSWGFDFDAKDASANIEDAFAYFDFLLEESTRPNATRESFEAAKESAEALRTSLQNFSVGEEYRAFLEDEALRPQTTSEEMDTAIAAAEALSGSLSTFAIGEEYRAFLEGEELRPQTTVDEMEAARREAEALANGLSTFEIGEEYRAFLEDEALRPQTTKEQMEEARTASEALSASMATFGIGEEYRAFLEDEALRPQATAEQMAEAKAAADALASSMATFAIGEEYRAFLEDEALRPQATADEIAAAKAEAEALAASLATFDMGEEYRAFLEPEIEQGKLADQIRQEVTKAMDAIYEASNAAMIEEAIGDIGTNHLVSIFKNYTKEAQNSISALNTQASILSRGLREAAEVALETGNWTAYNLLKVELEGVNLELERHQVLLNAAQRNDSFIRKAVEANGWTAEMSALNEEIRQYKLILAEAAATEGILAEDEIVIVNNALRRATIELDKLIEGFERAKKVEAFEKIQKAVRGATDVIGDMMEAFGASTEVIESFNQIGAAVDSAFSAAVSFASGDIIGGIVNTAKAIVGIFQWLRNLLTPEWQKVSRELQENIKQGVLAGLQSAARNYLISGDLEEFRNSFRQSVYQSVLDGLIQALVQKTVIEGALGPLIQQISDALAQGRGEDAAALIAGMDDEIDSIMESMTPVLDAFGDVFSDVLGEVEEVTEEIVETIPDIAENLPDPEEYRANYDEASQSLSSFGQFVSNVVAIPLYDASIRFENSVNAFGAYVRELVDTGISVTANSNVTINNTGIPAYN